MNNVFEFGNLQITTSADWLDVTNKILEHNPPFTLARPNGIGVIQFSTAAYKGGKVPEVTLEALRYLLEDFSHSRELGRGNEFASQESPSLLVSASFNFEDRYLRVWYCSDGRNIVLVTYNCQRGQQQAESANCESIVQSLKFKN